MFAKFDKNPAMTLQDIKETNLYRRTDGRTHGQRDNSIPTTNKGKTTMNQQQQNHRLRRDSSMSHQRAYWYQIFALDSAVVKIQRMFSSQRGCLLTIAMYHHGETILSNYHAMMNQRKGLTTHR